MESRYLFYLIIAFSGTNVGVSRTQLIEIIWNCAPHDHATHSSYFERQLQ